jgi:hypothetical protein
VATVPDLARQGPKARMINKELEMRTWHGILIAGGIAGSIAGCASSGSPGAMPDHFGDKFDVFMRSTMDPCGVDWDFDGDGKIDLSYTYTYDELGRSKQDLGVNPDGTLNDQIDYTWDNAGHLVAWRESFPPDASADGTSVYDALGRLVQDQERFHSSDIQDERWTTHYSDFDELSHPVHADELREDFRANTSLALTHQWNYDELGRRTYHARRLPSSELYNEYRYAYDDVARTTTLIFNAPHATSSYGRTLTRTDAYDADGHWVSSHDISTLTFTSGSSSTQVNDTVFVWSGDRELSAATTQIIDGVPLSAIQTQTFHYDCGTARSTGQ